jgi:hypothetical protein
MTQGDLPVDQKASAPVLERASRESLFLGAELETRGRSKSGRIRNISPSGALLETSDDLGIGETIVISFRGVSRSAAIVKRRNSKGYGIHFEVSIDPSACLNTHADPKGDPVNELVLSQLQGGRRPIWDNREANFFRPKMR